MGKKKWIKRKLGGLYNYLYDKKTNLKDFIAWRKDLIIQNKVGLPSMMSIDDTLDQIANDNLSICRYGDGEFKIMQGDYIFFQQENKILAQRLKEIIQSNEANILICIPSYLDRRHPIFYKNMRLNKDERKRRQSATRYLDNIMAERRLQWYKFFRWDKKYGDSLVSRVYADVYDNEKSNRWIQKWKKIWKNRNILIVEGELTRLGVGNDLFGEAKLVRRILAPPTNAFSKYNQLIEAVKDYYEDKDIVLLALGPTATVLAYDLAKLGIQALDVGHIDIEYEWFLRKDRTHQRIEGKYVSEAKDGSIVKDIMEKEYLDEIVKRVVD